MKLSMFPFFNRSPLASRILSIVALSLVFCTIILVIRTPVAFAKTLISPSPILAASLFHFSGSTPKNLGVKNGKLTTCPNSPNCVCSHDTDAEHQISPLTYTGNAPEAFKRLKTIIQGLENSKIVEDRSDYLYAEFTSKLMGFVDDVEFYLDETSGAIQVRSASRLGQSDLGVNRQRIETIRSKFNA
jgi:uncharacterized protein (DUF1499 family)